MELKNKKVIIIGGPTAVGKTSLAIRLAKHFNTEIISADSRQCYKELKIGVARPSDQELVEIKHHFIGTHSIHDKVSAASFEEYALQKTVELFQKNDTVVMVGGTGLYIKAFVEGFDEIPEVPSAIRLHIINEYRQHGLKWLQQQVAMLDPGFYATAEIQNPQRLMRALEVMKTTKKTVTEFRKGNKKKRDFNIVKIGLEIPKEVLHEHIQVRVNKMIEAGLVQEVKGLIPFRNLPALNTVGYKEIFEYLDKKLTLDKAIELINKNTRQYAKRQLTWFKKDTDFRWLHPQSFDTIIDFIK